MRNGCRLSLGGCRGFSVTEVTTILTALTILSGAAAPAVNDYVDQAKLVRARHDVRTLAVSLVRLFNDVGAERGLDKGWSSYTLLVGAGVAPASGARGSEAWTASTLASGVGLLDDQLTTNEPGYTRGRQGVPFGWRGAYLQDPVGADPWGHRYAVNIGAMQTSYDDTVVLSAGPDGTVDSPFEADGLPTAGDDIVSVVAAAGVGR